MGEEYGVVLGFNWRLFVVFYCLVFLMNVCMWCLYYLFYVRVDKNRWDFLVVFLVIFFRNVCFFVYCYGWVVVVCEVLVYFVYFVISGLNVVYGFFFDKLDIVKVDIIFKENLLGRWSISYIVVVDEDNINFVEEVKVFEIVY